MIPTLVKNYTAAIVALLESGVPAEEVLSNVKANLVKKGHQKLWPQILRSLTTALAEVERRAGAVVRVAKVSDQENAVVQQLLVELGAPQTVRTEIDESLIGGSVVTYQHRRLDNSFKKRLLDLYHQTTSQH